MGLGARRIFAAWEAFDGIRFEDFPSELRLQLLVGNCPNPWVWIDYKIIEINTNLTRADLG